MVQNISNVLNAVDMFLLGKKKYHGTTDLVLNGEKGEENKIKMLEESVSSST